MYTFDGVDILLIYHYGRIADPIITPVDHYFLDKTAKSIRITLKNNLSVLIIV